MDHLTGPNDENWFDFTAEFKATDSTGDEVPGDFQVKVVDDVPDAVDNTASVSEVVGDPQNVTLVVDVSASISGSALNDMTAGLKALVAPYAALGLPFPVTLIPFAASLGASETYSFSSATDDGYLEQIGRAPCRARGGQSV